MGRQFWSGMLAIVVGVFLLLAGTFGFAQTGAAPSLALLGGWLLSAAICLGIGFGQRRLAWGAPGFIELGGALVTALAWQGVANWWWPLGLVALGVGYVVLSELLPQTPFAGWREAMGVSAPFVAGVGAIWELGQVAGVVLLLSQATPLPAEDATALGASFLLSSLLLLIGSLAGGLLRRRLIALALSALLLEQLAGALVFNATPIGDPSASALLALAVLVVALICHAGTYPLRLLQPDLAPGKVRSFWRLFTWRQGIAPLKEALHTWRDREAWWLCLLLDSLALFFCLIAVLPVAGASAGSVPNGAPLLIVLSAGIALSLSVAYWRNAAWLLLLAGLFLGLDLFTIGLLSVIPTLLWPLLYLAATIALLGGAIWIAHMIGRAWALALLVVALGYGGLALAFAFQRHSPAWEFGIAAALVLTVLLAFWGWRRLQSFGKRP